VSWQRLRSSGPPAALLDEVPQHDLFVRRIERGDGYASSAAKLDLEPLPRNVGTR
jgi:hypothetical protein